MTRKGIWILLSVLLVLGLLIGAFGCKAGPTTTAPTTAPTTAAPSPTASPAPSPKPTASPTIAPTTAPTPAQPAVIKWRGQRMYPRSAPIDRFKWHDGILGTGGFGQTWKDFLESHSGGRLQMDLAEPGAIVPVADMLTAVEKGTLDFIAHGWAGMWTGVVPEANVEIGLPFAWETPAELFDCLYNWGFDAKIKEVYAERGVWPHLWPNGDLYSFYANFDPTSPQSFKGKKIRAYGGWGKLVEAMGATPAAIAGADLYMALKLGTVDGSIYGFSGLSDWKHYEVVKYLVTEPNLTTIGCTFYVNMKSLNALPADLKKMVIEDSVYLTSTYVHQYYTFVNYTVKQAELKGYCKIVKWTGADRDYIYNLGIKTWDEIAKLSPRTSQLVDIIKAQAREYGKIK